MVKVIHSLSTELGNPPGRYQKAGWGQRLRTESRSPEDAGDLALCPGAAHALTSGWDLRPGIQAHYGTHCSRRALGRSTQLLPAEGVGSRSQRAEGQGVVTILN